MNMLYKNHPSEKGQRTNIFQSSIFFGFQPLVFQGVKVIGFGDPSGHPKFTKPRIFLPWAPNPAVKQSSGNLENDQKLMVQKSQTTTWDGSETRPIKSWDIYHINWLAGFLNHQQFFYFGGNSLECSHHLLTWRRKQPNAIHKWSTARTSFLGWEEMLLVHLVFNSGTNWWKTIRKKMVIGRPTCGDSFFSRGGGGIWEFFWNFKHPKHK